MDIQDWGAAINFLPPSSCWLVPKEVDGLFPHFYFGMHCPDMPFETALQIAAAHWISLFLAWDKPVLVGEYGTAGLTWENWLRRNEKLLSERYQLFSANPNREAFHADVMRACLEGWLKMGVQGAFYWAWRSGIPGMDIDQRTYTLTHGFEVLKEFAPKFKKPNVVAANAKVAVVCNKGRRARYGALQDLALISQVLVGLGITPYHVLFDEAIMAERVWLGKLRRYDKVIVLADGLTENVLTKIQSVVPPNRLFVVRQSELQWQNELERFVLGRSR